MKSRFTALHRLGLTPGLCRVGLTRFNSVPVPVRLSSCVGCAMQQVIGAVRCEAWLNAEAGALCSTLGPAGRLVRCVPLHLSGS